MDFDGLQRDLVRAIGGFHLPVDVGSFQNDMASVASRDDVLTLLVHLGYLNYNFEAGEVYAPNEEVRLELARAVSHGCHPLLVDLMKRSAKLLDDMVNMRADDVAEGISRFHDETTAPLFYNGEQALRSVVKTALISAVDDYARIEELPSGHGLADVVYLPKRFVDRPALLVELKWDKPVKSAIDQIHNRDYPSALRDLDIPVLLVGITYDTQSKQHDCRIELVDES